MKSHYSIISAVVRPEIQEKISIGLLLVSTTGLYFSCSRNKLAVVRSLIDATETAPKRTKSVEVVKSEFLPKVNTHFNIERELSRNDIPDLLMTINVDMIGKNEVPVFSQIVDFRVENLSKRYFETGRELKFQLKATTENSIIDDGDTIKYDLNASAYNDLLTRKDSKNPLILILFILPPDKNTWVNISDKELIARRCAYWFFPEDSIPHTENTSTKRISINKNNLISNESLNLLFENYS
jgi:hypothetical protein